MHEYRFADLVTQTLAFESAMMELAQAEPGDVVLLHGCCHNPTGLDLNVPQWQAVTYLCAARGLVPFVDLAYQGLGDGLDEDAHNLRRLMDAIPEALLAYSCDKNFGLYRERTGALFVKSRTPQVTASNMAIRARVNWSMPPDHGAAVVRLVLERDDLRALWLAELAQMAERLRAVRQAIANTDVRLGAVARQRGMFSTLALDKSQVAALRTNHAIYLAPSGRMNIAGLVRDDASRFVEALESIAALRGAETAS